ncbi:unnamed protein product [Sphagnum balticum]
MNLKGEEPFKASSPVKDFFSSNTEVFFDGNIKKEEKKKEEYKVIRHESPFKLISIAPGKPFSPLVYKEEGEDEREAKTEKKENKQNI